MFENGGIIFENGGIIFKNAGIIFENGGIVFENAGIIFENAAITFENGNFFMQRSGDEFPGTRGTYQTKMAAISAETINCRVNGG